MTYIWINSRKLGLLENISAIGSNKILQQSFDPPKAVKLEYTAFLIDHKSGEFSISPLLSNWESSERSYNITNKMVVGQNSSQDLFVSCFSGTPHSHAITRH